MQQARRDIDAVDSMGLFDDVKFLPQPSEDSSLENPTVDLTLQVKERKNGGLSAGCGISAQVRLVIQFLFKSTPNGVVFSFHNKKVFCFSSLSLHLLALIVLLQRRLLIEQA